MKTILVLGGAGYIGSHTVYELIDNGYDVVVADNLEKGFRKAVHPKARFYQGDIRNKEFCDHVFSSEKIDAVIHFAANSQVGESMVNPLKYYDNNLGGTRTMLQSMIEHGVKYIVFSSTAATHGEPERVPILETDPTRPTNCYGIRNWRWSGCSIGRRSHTASILSRCAISTPAARICPVRSARRTIPKRT